MKIRKLRVPLAALPLAVLAALPSHAQTLSETLVTATRVEQPLTDVVADVTVIDRSILDRSGASALADVLARVPGISFVRNGGPASTTSLYVRGAETRFTAVFVDGVRVDSQSTGGATWQALPVSQIDRVEVVRGPAAAVYGSDALGGVIQIFTRKGEPGFAPSVEFGLGTHGTRKLSASLSSAAGSVDYALGVTRETSDGFNAQPTGNPDKDGYRSTSASARLGLQINPAHRIEATLLDSEQDAQYDAFTPGRDDHALQDVQTLGLSWSAQWSDSYKTRLSVGRSSDRYETTPSVYATDTTVSSYLWHNEWKFGSNQFTAALERREDRLNNASTTPAITQRSQNGLALGYGFRSGAHTLQLNARHDDDSEFGGQSTGGAAYAFAFMPQWRALVSAGTAFRAPTLFQRFSIYGTPNLEPETARNVEAGVKFDNAQGGTFSAIAYRNKVSNLITYVSGPGSCVNGVGAFPGCYGNTASAQYAGLTLAGTARMGAVALGASLDLQNPEDLTTKKQLARRPKKIATLTADAPVGGWKLGAELQLVGERFNNATNTQRLAGYGLLNLTASTLLAKDWTLLGRVDNLGDKTYETARGFANGGRMVYVGLKWAPI
ncbi:MAG: TonB-dependent receptor [Hydrogenophaga sp.]|uniref:TonB-dependent receptor domain-containing protein n=1 Tax=Hydrogenophaga sp. TaxID=1904254 RepID=UPI002ABB0DB9|nr:TonB-dependent receptor [Hydrogenophaga sp.]MDZ4279532.1 TonB-dependent receptor [Hydrogenophaga sp.]